MTLALALAAIGMSVVPPGASADWPRSGRPVTTAPDAQVHASIATDGADGAIITWQDFRSPRVNVFAQHVLASGELDPAWPTNGRPLLADSAGMATADGGQTSPVIVADGAGGAIVAWLDNRSNATGTDVFAQHVLASGALDPAWPPNGAEIIAVKGVQNSLAMVSDGAGGAIVAWVDNQEGLDQPDIYAQRILASGAVDPAWAGGVSVCVTSGPQEFPALLADGAGGAIVTWQDLRDPATGFDVYVQHVLGSGQVDLAFPGNGRAVCTAPGGQGRPTITSDGAGGAIVVWTDSRVIGTSHIFAHHMFATGTLDRTWPVNGQLVSGATFLESRPVAVPDGSGGAVVAWQGFDIHLNIYAQHLTAVGVVDPGWPAGGRALTDSEITQRNAEIVSDGAGGAVLAWQDSVRILAQHVLASGTLDPSYPATGLVMSDLPGRQGDAVLVATGGAGAIVAWTDDRSGVDLDIFAMQVLIASTLGVPPITPRVIAFAAPRPNPSRGSVTLRFALTQAASVRLQIYDVAGHRVRELASGTRPEGVHDLAWDLRDERGAAIRAGLYFARLEAGGRVHTQKLVTLE